MAFTENQPINQSILYDELGNPLSVDSSKRLVVSTASPIPPGSNPVQVLAQGSVAGSSQVDTDYVVPDTKTLTVTQFFAGGETGGKESKFELYHSSDAGVTDGVLLAFGYIGGGDSNVRTDLDVTVVGSGVATVIRLRRERLDAVSRELAAAWEGHVTV